MKTECKLIDIAVAQVLAAVINAEGGHGAFGGKPVIPEGNKIRVTSQGPTVEFFVEVDDEGKIIIKRNASNIIEEYESIKQDLGYSDEQMLDEYGTVEEYVASYESDSLSNPMMSFSDAVNVFNPENDDVHEKALALIKSIVKCAI